MDKVAFVVVRYGLDINGGAEYHCRMLAERLVPDYQVEVLTTCVKNYVTGNNEYAEGTETINGVLVRRFMAQPVEKDLLGHFVRKSRRAIKRRKLLYRLHLLGLFSSIKKIWTFKEEWDLKEYMSCVFYSPDLFSFIKEHKADYKVFIPITIDFPPVYYTALYAPEKTIVIPTMHYQRAAFRPLLTRVFTRAAYIAFNTEAEQRLARRIFGHSMSAHGVVGVGCELAAASDWGLTSAKYGLPSKYLLYVGRIDRDKIQQIFDYFMAYKQKYQTSELKFVLVGGCFCDVPQHPDIIYTGFVGENEKTAIIEHAEVVVNPSRFESLSLILLEVMSLKKPMLVNGHCDVMKDHCKKSDGAALAYYDKKSFVKQLHRVESSANLRTAMGEKGKKYVEENYDWSLIMKRLTACIERVSSQKMKNVANVEK